MADVADYLLYDQMDVSTSGSARIGAVTDVKLFKPRRSSVVKGIAMCDTTLSGSC